MKKTVFRTLFVITLGLFLFLAIEKTEDPPIEKITEVVVEEETYTLLFGGDMMLDRGVKYMVEKHGENYHFPFLNIQETLISADLLFANLESMISDKGYDVGGLYSFRADPEAMEGLVFAGFDIVTLANNHTFDYTREAFEDTMKRLEEAGIAYTGAGFNEEEAHSPTILLLEDGTKIGFLGYTEFLYPHAFATEDRSGVTVFNEENMERDIVKAKEEVDLLVVTFHYGDEYKEKAHPRQETWSRSAVDHGADLVIGHHPHVTQQIEEYNGKYIAYSLGNFIFDQYFSEETMSGFLFEVSVKGKEIVGARKIHYKLNEFYQPKVTEIETLE